MPSPPSSSSFSAAPSGRTMPAIYGAGGGAGGCLPADQACFAFSSAASSPYHSASTRRNAAAAASARACCTTASYVVVLGISFGSLLAILLILCVIRWYLVWQSARQRRDDGAAADEARGSDKKRSAGLDADAIAALPEFAYKREEAGGSEEEDEEERECAVCLAVMADGEAARRLPRCMHVFHRGCVDVWLRENSTCPVCRAEVVVRPAGAVRADKLPESSTSRALTSPAQPAGMVDDRRERDLEAQQ
ncbi:hypothetical protein E2562_010251 [Oryza meyeriana var. granulata]|uniref:RING-type E3 ubiquitin transferase n=1 Tax=Oryza meyeriana var. granulata TaxID=110450 RepID=A0A6G1EJR4_9ORYZ|nr:hypothetical protein E2562_010251 [Oryza meyeriana var. granulata]